MTQELILKLIFSKKIMPKSFKLKDEILVKISSQIIVQIDKILQQINYHNKKIIFVSDSNIWKHNQAFFTQDFIDKFAQFLILDNPKADEKNVQIIAKNSADCDLIFAFGSGTINDLCKYVAKLYNKNYAILISALSMNGYASKNASITINNHKKTLEATLPVAILCDLSIIKNCPTHLTKAGLADVLCFYSCFFDLMLSKYIFLQTINLPALNLQQKIVNNFVKNYAKYSLHDTKFLTILCKMILNSGWAMTIANSSAPASQSEHLLAHVLTMKYPDKLQNILHGRLIGATTIFTLAKQQQIFTKISQENFVKNYAHDLKSDIENNENRKKIIQYFGKEIGQECLLEYDLKLDFLVKNHRKIINNLTKNHRKIIAKLNNILGNFSTQKEELIKIFHHYEVDFSFNNINLDDAQIIEAQQFCKYIRNRLTSSDI